MGVCTSFIEPLNLECLFINNLSGSVGIFTALSMIVISLFAARFKMPNEIALIMFAFFTIVMSTYMRGIFVFGILIIGLITFFSVRKIIDS